MTGIYIPAMDMSKEWKAAVEQLYGWDANPWVWVIEFERCEKPKEEV